MTAVTSSSDLSVVPPAGEVTTAMELRPVDARSHILQPSYAQYKSKSESLDHQASNDDSENDHAISFSERCFVLPRCAVPLAADMQPVEAFVEAAVLEQDALAETAAPVKNYKVILDCIRQKRDIDMLRKLLIALRTSGHGSTMHRLTCTKKHARLIHPVLRLNPFEIPIAGSASNSTEASSPPVLGPDYDLADAQLHFLAAVVSSNAVFLVPTITSTWKLLTSQREKVSLERTRRCHAFLATVLRLVPKAKAELFPVLSACAPFRSRDVSEIVHYYRSCLVVLQYHPGLQTSVLDLLVDKCLEMDVEIKISDLGEASIDSTENDKAGADATGCFELELDGLQATTKPESSTVDEMATRLDALMMLIFEYMDQSNSPLTMLYDILVRVFESSILICYKSKFVQYLLFYLCGLHERTQGGSGDIKADHDTSVVLHRDFLSKLINIVLDPFRATATRQSGACYVASFVSRARFVAPDTVCEAVSALLRWAEAYLQLLDASDASGVVGVTTSPGQMTMEDVHEQCSLHSLFYTVCQSAFYIMCFRGAEALSHFKESISSAQDDEFYLQHVDISRERWSRICGHRTQPLRFCLESVRVEFLALATSHALLDGKVMQSLQSQQELSLMPGRSRKVANVIRTAATLEKERLSGGVGGLGRGQNPLDSFFPFDPYLLSKSYSYVEPLYIHWCGVAGESGISRSMSPTIGLDDAGEADAPSDDDEDDDDTSQVLGSVGSASAEPDENDSKSGSEDDEDSDEEEDGSSARQAMSFVSTSTTLQVAGPGTPVAALKPDELRAAWTDTLKRSRAASVENGSW